MAGKSPVTATVEQRQGLERQAKAREREEADRARAILLSLSGWTSARIGEALRVREDTVRDWRSAFMREGLVGIARHVEPGAPPVKAQAALQVAGALFADPVANRTNWTLPRLKGEIERQTGQTISRSRLSVVLRQKGALLTSGRATR